MSEFKDKDFLEFVLQSLVTKPDDILIERKIDEMGVLYIVKVAKEDISKVIGKQGQTVKAIRLLLKTVGYLNHVRANLKIDTDTKIN